MIRAYFPACLVALTCTLMSMKVEGQSTIDDQSEICNNILPTSEQVANLIRQGVEKVIASSLQQVEPSKQLLVSALVCT